MKKLITYIPILICFILASCADNEVDPLFDKPVNERTEELKQEYYDILISAENGWIGAYAPNEDFALYTVIMKFDSESLVTINSDYQAGNQDNTSTYRLDKTLKIELVLESDGIFHSIFALNNNGIDGEYVFNILSATQDEIVLESKLDFGDDKTILKLRRAIASDTDFQSIYDTIDNLVGGASDSGVRDILFNGEVIGDFSFNEDSRSITLTYEENGESVTQVVRIILTATGFILDEPVTINGAILNSFNFDEPNNSYIEAANPNLIIDDFKVCEFDINSFVGVYSANEDGYCDGCYQVTAVLGTEPNTLKLTNLYDYGYTTTVTLDPNATVNNIKFGFGEQLYYSNDYAQPVLSYNPSALSGNVADDISTYSVCDNYMNLYFRQCLADNRCFTGNIHIQLTKL